MAGDSISKIIWKLHSAEGFGIKNSLEIALGLAELGFYVMPLVYGGKTPIMKGIYRSYSTRDPDQIKKFFTCALTGDVQPHEVGINTDKFGEDETLIVIDIDRDVDKNINGLDIVKQLQKQGRSFPKTLIQKTPRGGFHLIYRAKETITGGAKVFGEDRRGVDIRSFGGLIVYYGFADDRVPPVVCPPWVKKLREESKKTEIPKTTTQVKYNRFSFIMETAEEGHRADTCYKMANKFIDHGLGYDDALEQLMVWNESSCFPPLSGKEVAHQLRSALSYRIDKPGSALAVNQFEEVDEIELKNVDADDHENLNIDADDQDPISKYNEEFAFCLEGGSSTILWETSDIDGKFLLDRLKLTSFHERFAADKIFVGESSKAATKVWMDHPKRRTYDRVVFAPGMDISKSQYNLWNGFSEHPLARDEKPTPQMVDGLGAFLEHLKDNIAGEHSNWLISFFAHLVQRPQEKPLVALVVRGPKGTGKDSLIDRVGHLISRYYVMAADPRFFIGNFNAHLEHCLMIVLNEAFWSGDKKAEGILKNLITGNKHLIERKGKEVITARNFTRVVILGNEKWIVPATADERRFAVFDIGTARIGDTKFFNDMRKNMEAGGYRHLLRYLLDYKIDLEVNIAPNNKALLNQKIEGLEPLKQWWRTCLGEGYVLGHISGDEMWPNFIGCEELRDAFYKHSRDRGIRSRLESAIGFGHEIKHLGNLTRFKQRRERKLHNCYRIPTLEQCREYWDIEFGQKNEWIDIEEIEDVENTEDVAL